jgi:hypothetical protein
MRNLCLALPVLLACAAPAAAQQSAQDKEWIARCVSQISEANKPRARAYCTCMAQTIDTSEKFDRQTELERSYPPVHRECFRKAGFKVPN